MADQRVLPRDAQQNGSYQLHGSGDNDFSLDLRVWLQSQIGLIDQFATVLFALPQSDIIQNDRAALTRSRRQPFVGSQHDSRPLLEVSNVCRSISDTSRLSLWQLINRTNSVNCWTALHFCCLPSDIGRSAFSSGYNKKNFFKFSDLQAEVK